MSDIRALTPADAKAALDRLIAEAEERGAQKAADEITRLRAEVERLQRSLATIALLSDCSSSVGEARAALGDDRGEGR